jgi:tetratricopeptide (TPR) repeat protein
MLGDYSMARDCYEKALQGIRERGDRYGQGLILANLGWIANMRGDLATANACQEQALLIAREVGNPYHEAYTLINLSALAAVQGDAIAALDYARSANDLCRSIGERSGEAWSLLNMGHALVLQEDLEQAHSSYEQCVAIREELRQPNLAAEALSGLLAIALLRDNKIAIQEYVDRIQSIMDSDRDFAGAEDALRIYFTLHAALEKMQDPRRQAVLEHARQQLETQVSKFKDEAEARRYIENAPWRLALWNADRSRD